jgi:hypothetical protein
VSEERKRLHPLGAAGALVFAAGLLAWLWLGEWRWAVTGLLVFFALVVAVAALDARRDRRG